MRAENRQGWFKESKIEWEPKHVYSEPLAWSTTRLLSSTLLASFAEADPESMRWEDRDGWTDGQTWTHLYLSTPALLQLPSEPRTEGTWWSAPARTELPSFPGSLGMSFCSYLVVMEVGLFHKLSLNFFLYSGKWLKLIIQVVCLDKICVIKSAPLQTKIKPIKKILN